jgi:hypothetical protein
MLFIFRIQSKSGRKQRPNCETLVDKKVSEIEEKIRLLKTMKQVLVQLKQACKADQREDPCLIEELYHRPNQTAVDVAR